VKLLQFWQFFASVQRGLLIRLHQLQKKKKKKKIRVKFFLSSQCVLVANFSNKFFFSAFLISSKLKLTNTVGEAGLCVRKKKKLI
jgi:hypothetical protein